MDQTELGWVEVGGRADMGKADVGSQFRIKSALVVQLEVVQSEGDQAEVGQVYHSYVHKCWLAVPPNVLLISGLQLSPQTRNVQTIKVEKHLRWSHI